MISTQFKSIGRDLFTRGLVSSHSGNLSIRMGDRIIITRRGSQLGSLEEHDLVETGLTRNDRATPLASIELPLHRAIYQSTQARAIVHAHPVHAIALSLASKEISAICMEGEWLGAVPVVGWNRDTERGTPTDIIAQTLKENHIVMVRGHGCFAIGQLLEEALNYTTSFEANCEVMCLLKSIQSNTAKDGSFPQ